MSKADSLFRDKDYNNMSIFKTSMIEKLDETKLNSINVSKIHDDYESNQYDGGDDPLLLNKLKSKMTSLDLENGPVQVTLVSKKKFMQNNADLTPLPKVTKSKLINKNDESLFHEAERTTVQIRRIEYANSMSEKVVMLKKDFLFFNNPERIDKIKKLQRWWKKQFKLIRSSVKIQSYFKGYLLRNKINFLIEGMKTLKIQLAEFVRILRNFAIKTIFSTINNFSIIRWRYLTKLIYLQSRIKRFIKYIKKKKANLKNGFNKIFALRIKRLKHAFIKMRNYSKLQHHMKLIQEFIKEKMNGLDINLMKKNKSFFEVS